METAAPANSTVVSVKSSLPTNYVTLKHLQELRQKEKQQQQQQQQSEEENKEEEEDEEKKKRKVIDLTETRSRRDSQPRGKNFVNRWRRAISEANLEDPDSGWGSYELMSTDVVVENVNREEPKASDIENGEADVEATDGGRPGSTNVETNFGSVGADPKAAKKLNYRRQRQQRSEEENKEKEKKKVIDHIEMSARRDSQPQGKKFRNRRWREANLKDPDSGCAGDELVSRGVVAESVNSEEPKPSDKANREAAGVAADGGRPGSKNLEAKLGSTGEEPKATKKRNCRKKKNGAKPTADGDQKNGAKPKADGKQKSEGGEGKLLQIEVVSEQFSSLSVKEMEENYENSLKKIDRQWKAEESQGAVSGDMDRKRFNGYRGGRRGAGRCGPSREATVARRKDVNVMWLKKETCLAQDRKV